MQFDLTDDQKSIEDVVRTFLTDQLPEQTNLKLFTDGKMDDKIWQGLAELGLGSILVPTEHEGLGMDLLTLAVVSEALGYFAAPAPVIANALAAWLVATTGNDAQRKTWLEALTSGTKIAAFALSEESGWFPENWTASGNPVTGKKQFVEWAEKADLFIVGTKGGGLSLVPRSATGITITPMEGVDRGRPFATVQFDNTPAEPLAVKADTAELLRDALLVLLAADACGVGFRAQNMAVEYAKVRTQFGRVIGSFQAMKHQFANMAIQTGACRPMYWFAAHMWDTSSSERAETAATAKAHITDVAVRTARAAVEAHGGIGYTWEYPLHMWLKRAMYDRTAMGLPTLHRERAAALSGW